MSKAVSKTKAPKPARFLSATPVFETVLQSKADFAKALEWFSSLDVIERNDFPLYLVRITLVAPGDGPTTSWFPLTPRRNSSLIGSLKTSAEGGAFQKEADNEARSSEEEIIYRFRFITGIRVVQRDSRSEERFSAKKQSEEQQIRNLFDLDTEEDRSIVAVPVTKKPKLSLVLEPETDEEPEIEPFQRPSSEIIEDFPSPPQKTGLTPEPEDEIDRAASMLLDGPRIVPIQRPPPSNAERLEREMDEYFGMTFPLAPPAPTLPIPISEEVVVEEEGDQPEDDRGHLSEAETDTEPPFNENTNENAEIDIFGDIFDDFPSLKRSRTPDSPTENNVFSQKHEKTVRRGQLFAHKFRDLSIYDKMAPEFKRWQVVKDIDQIADIKMLNVHDILKDNCFVYAMKQLLKESTELTSKQKRRIKRELIQMNVDTRSSFVKVKKMLMKLKKIDLAIKILSYPSVTPNGPKVRTKPTTTYITRFGVKNTLKDASLYKGVQQKNPGDWIVLSLGHTDCHFFPDDVITDREKLRLFGIKNQVSAHSGALLSKAIREGMTKQIVWKDSSEISGEARTVDKLMVDPVLFFDGAFQENETKSMCRPPPEVLENIEMMKKAEEGSEDKEPEPHEYSWFCDFETFISSEVGKSEKKINENGELTKRDWHKIYCCSCCDYRGNRKQTFFGDKCFGQMVAWIRKQSILEEEDEGCDDNSEDFDSFFKKNTRLRKYLDNNGPLLYFHNLKYDSCFVLQSTLSIFNNVEKGNRLLMFDGIVLNDKEKHRFQCKDTLGILSCKLADAPNQFWSKNKTIKVPDDENGNPQENVSPQDIIKRQFGKEVFPYKALTSTKTEFVELQTCLDILREQESDLEKQEEDIKLFCERIVENEKFRHPTDEKLVNIKTYCAHYCERDCELLSKAWAKATSLYSSYPIELDIDKCLTTAGMANKYFNRECFSKKTDNKRIFAFEGKLRAFEQRGIRGGRCMTRDNESWWIKNMDILDFDAVSLYPSAMNRLYCQLGEPKRLPEEFRGDCSRLLQFTADEDQHSNGTTRLFDAFTVIAVVKRIGKPLHFPLLSYKDENGCHWTNTPRPSEILVLNEINLADLVQFQDAEIEILDGYVWNEGKDFTCREKIKELFDFRRLKKSEGNPIEVTVKLIMNSAYGKTVMKLIKTEKQYVKNSSLEGHVIRHANKITNFYKITPVLWCVEHEKEYYDARGKSEAGNALPNWWGVRILAMSKRIMAEVMCLAEDIDAKIYYTDTDSMQIEAEGVKRLEKAFFEKYRRPLVGPEMGQFHSDFDSKKGKVLHATEGIYVAKKIYCCRLLVQTSSGELVEDFHKRMKGIPQFAIDSFNPQDPMEVYRRLFSSIHKSIPWELDPENKTDENRVVYVAPVTFPLCEPGKGRFVFTKDKQIYTDISLERKVGNKNLVRNVWTYAEDGSVEKEKQVINFSPNVPTSTIPPTPPPPPPTPTPEVEVEVEDEAEQPKEPWSCEEYSDHIDIVL